MKYYVSMGDINGISAEIILSAHEQLHGRAICYGIDTILYHHACALLKHDIIDICCIDVCQQDLNPLFDSLFPKSPAKAHIQHILSPFSCPTIKPGAICAEMGKYSCKSFLLGVLQAQSKQVDALITLPIHKQAWKLACIPYAGHTELLRELYEKEVIMAMGCEEMMFFLYTDHIPLRMVADLITPQRLYGFLKQVVQFGLEQCGVLGLNPHAGDNGLIGDEEKIIDSVIKQVNSEIGKEVFIGPLVPDSAFTPKNRYRFKHYVAFYHDQALIPLKAFYFDESINMSLGLPIVRVSVDHGCAFDIAYKKHEPSIGSFMQAFMMADSILKKDKHGRI